MVRADDSAEAALAVTMGIGITLLAVLAGVHAAQDPTQLGLPADAMPKTVLAQVSAAVFGPASVGFYAIQVFTAAILILAANTSFNGFPGLASILGRDRYFPASSTTAGTGWSSATTSCYSRCSPPC